MPVLNIVEHKYRVANKKYPFVWAHDEKNVLKVPSSRLIRTTFLELPKQVFAALSVVAFMLLAGLLIIRAAL